MQYEITAHSIGVGGMTAIETVTQGDDGDTLAVTFYGSIYGGPIIMQMDDGPQTLVVNPDRFGTVLDDDWVARFHGV